MNRLFGYVKIYGNKTDEYEMQCYIGRRILCLVGLSIYLNRVTPLPNSSKGIFMSLGLHSTIFNIFGKLMHEYVMHSREAL